MATAEIYKPKHHVRFVTASSLFDGHDASINIMRRILQSSGAEVIHLGHNRSVEEVVNAAIQEDVQGIAISSYQGGHVEYFKYMYDLLQERGAPHIRIYGGGGGVIIPKEIKELHDYGIAWIFSPEDGRKMGLQGMINRMIEECDFLTAVDNEFALLEKVTTDTPEILANLHDVCGGKVRPRRCRCESIDQKSAKPVKKYTCSRDYGDRWCREKFAYGRTDPHDFSRTAR